jgi:uncharacterized membrane protein
METSMTKTFGLSTNRIEAFTDGVFAVAITLLILEVKVPHLEPGMSLLHELQLLWPKLLSYAVSFGVIGIFWVGHHIMFHYIKRSDRILLWLNTLLLMFVSAIPFSAALIGEYREDPVAVACYGVLLALTGLVFLVLWLYASKGHRLIRESMPIELVRLGTKTILLAPVVYAIAAGVAFYDPLVSKMIYFLVPLLYLIPSPIDRLVHFRDE